MAEKKLKIGMAVWVRNSLEEGVMAERKIKDFQASLNSKNEIVKLNGISLEYDVKDLIFDGDEAKEICRQALRRIADEAQEKLKIFNANNPYYIPPISLPYVSSAWEID
jgi:hypothetical protein